MCASTMQSEIRPLVERKMQSEARGVHSSGYAKWMRTVHSTPHQYAFVETLFVFQGRRTRWSCHARSLPRRSCMAYSPVDGCATMPTCETRPHGFTMVRAGLQRQVSLVGC